MAQNSCGSRYISGLTPPDQPEDLKDNLPENAEGVKKEKVLVSATAVPDEFWSLLYSRFSTWERLRRVVAWLMRVRRKRGVRGSRETRNGDAHDDIGNSSVHSFRSKS